MSIFNCFGTGIMAGGGYKLVALPIYGRSSGSARMYTSSSTSGDSWQNSGLVVNDGMFFGGHSNFDARRNRPVNRSGTHYILHWDGKIYTTRDFRQYTLVAISSISDNGGATTFNAADGLFIYYDTTLSKYVSFASNASNQGIIRQSTDDCVTWTTVSTHSAASWEGLVSNGTYFLAPSNTGDIYCGIAQAGQILNKNSSTATGSFSVQNGACATYGGQFIFDASHGGGSRNVVGVPVNATASSSSFDAQAYSCALVNQTVKGLDYGRTGAVAGRAVAIGDSGGLLKISYSDSVTSAWIAATVPSITIGSDDNVKILGLYGVAGFIASWYNTSTPSTGGFLYSADGITWSDATVADTSAFSACVNIYEVGT